MKIEVSKNLNNLHPHPRGPHFWQLHDRHLCEDSDGEEYYRLPLTLVIKHLQVDAKDPARCEAIARVFANCGVTINWPLLWRGETAPAKLFKAWNRDNLRGDEIRIPLESMALVLGHKESHGDADGETLRNIIIEFLKEVGIEPNLERIDAEFCKTCRRVRSVVMSAGGKPS